MIAILGLLIFCGNAFAAEKVETVIFYWDQQDRTLLEKWELHWSDASGGPYVPLTDFIYGGEDQINFESQVEATVTGDPASTVTKFFVLRACGTVDGTYFCSDWSNQASYDFKIPFGGFQVPVNFRVVPNQ